jgi:hypothetical protein
MKELKAPWSRVVPPPGRYWVAVWQANKREWTPQPMLVDLFVGNLKGQRVFNVLVLPEPPLDYELGNNYHVDHPDNEPMAWAPCAPPEVA